MTLVQLKIVMAGLDPTIHVLATDAGGAGNRVDARVEPAHDELGPRFRGDDEKNEGATA